MGKFDRAIRGPLLASSSFQDLSARARAIRLDAWQAGGPCPRCGATLVLRHKRSILTLFRKRTFIRCPACKLAKRAGHHDSRTEPAIETRPRDRVGDHPIPWRAYKEPLDDRV